MADFCPYKAERDAAIDRRNRLVEENCVLRRRAEAAEALLETLYHDSPRSSAMSFEDWCASYSPAEALRAKHRSPQSGQAQQEEGSDEPTNE